MCNYEGCERANYRSNGKEWDYCIFHLPKGPISDEIKELIAQTRNDEPLATLKEFMELDKEEQEKIKRKFWSEMNKEISDIDLNVEIYEQLDALRKGRAPLRDVLKKYMKYKNQITNRDGDNENDISLYEFIAGEEEGESYYLDDLYMTADEEVGKRTYYNFDGFWFSEFDFRSHEFKEHATFRKAIFTGEVEFGGVKFLKEARFEYSGFNGEANFVNCLFSEETNFANVVFSKKVYLYNIKTSGEIYLNNTKFLNSCHFNGAIIDNKLIAQNARFAATAFFTNVNFNAPTDFRKTIFAYANFKEARFNSDADFKDVEFKTGGDFKDSNFLGKVRFSGIKIKNILSFKDTSFVGEGDVNFGGIRISEIGQIFLNDTLIDKIIVFQNIPNKLRIVLSGIKITANGEIRFVKCNMDEVSFLQVPDMDKIEFIGVEWPHLKNYHIFDDPAIKKDYIHAWCSECSSLIVTEKTGYTVCPICKSSGNKGPKYIEPEKLYSYLSITYELLRKNYEARNRHVEAGDFYIGEMEARKKWLEYREHKTLWEKLTDWGYRRLIGTYSRFSKYGESTLRPFLWIIALILFFGVIYDYSNFTNMFFKLSEFNLDQLINSINNSAHILYQLPVGSLKNNIVALIERLIGLLLNALLILSLNRKFRRRD